MQHAIRKFMIDGEEKSTDDLASLNLSHLVDSLVADTFYEKREALENTF